jgi:ribosome-binding protein aMBF1 (putative translation factor)
MPARSRDIGPEVSQRVADVIERARLRRGWTRPELSGYMAELGYQMSASTIRHIERGITEGGTIRTRIISVDEARALAEALGIMPELTRVIFREG